MANVPFNIPFPGGVRPGTMVKIRGTTPPGAQRIDVMMVSGATNTSDVPLHLWFNFQDGSLHLNNVTGGSTPGQTQQIRSPLQVGQPFEIAILCEQPGFRVAVNGMQVAQFRHRLPFQNITNLAATGQMVVQNVSFEMVTGPPPVPGVPPPGISPQGMPPQGMPPQGMPQQGMMPMQQQGYPPPQQMQQSGKGGMLGTLGGLAAGAVAGGVTGVIASNLASGGGGGGGRPSGHGGADTSRHDASQAQPSAASPTTPQQAHTDQASAQSGQQAEWGPDQQAWGQTDQSSGQDGQSWGQTDQGWGQNNQQAAYGPDQDDGWGQSDQFDQDGWNDGGGMDDDWS